MEILTFKEIRMKTFIFSFFAFFLLIASPAPAVNLSIPTSASTGTLYPIGAALGNLWSSKLPDVRASVQASKGGVQNLQLLSRGEAQISFAVTGITFQAMKGLDKFKGHAYPNVRIMAGLYHNPNQIIAGKGSEVEKLTDFQGKTFVPGVVGGTTVGEASVHFKAAGMDYPNCVKAQYVGPAEAADLLRNRRIDGAWIMAGLPNAGVSEMCSTTGAHLVEVEDTVLDALRKEYPWYVRFVIPADTYPHQTKPIKTSAVKMVLITDVSLPEELVYRLTKTFWENLELVRRSHAVLKSLDIKDAVTDLADIPLHKGAERYYREVGVLK